MRGVAAAVAMCLLLATPPVGASPANYSDSAGDQSGGTNVDLLSFTLDSDGTTLKLVWTVDDLFALQEESRFRFTWLTPYAAPVIGDDRFTASCGAGSPRGLSPGLFDGCVASHTVVDGFGASYTEGVPAVATLDYSADTLTIEIQYTDMSVVSGDALSLASFAHSYRMVAHAVAQAGDSVSVGGSYTLV